MYQMHKANMANLTSLWKRYGATTQLQQPGVKYIKNEGWPHRAWLELESPRAWIGDFTLAGTYKDLAQRISTEEIIPVINKNSIHPLEKNADIYLPEEMLEDSPCELAFSQTAMYAERAKLDVSIPENSMRLTFRKVACREGLAAWTNICGEAFDYKIDMLSVARLMNDPDTDLLIGFLNDVPVMTALVHRTGNIAGIHQFGVRPIYRGDGLATEGMKIIIMNWIKERYITLQASAAGYPLYKKLGFVDQFQILNYQRQSY